MADASGEQLMLMLPAQALQASRMPARSHTAKVGSVQPLTLPSTPCQIGQSPVFTPVDRATTAWRTQVCPNAPQRHEVVSPLSVSGASTVSSRVAVTRLRVGRDDSWSLCPRIVGLGSATPLSVRATPCNVPSTALRTQECPGAPSRRDGFCLDMASAGSTPLARQGMRSVNLWPSSCASTPHSARCYADHRLVGSFPLQRRRSVFTSSNTPTSGSWNSANSPANSVLNRGFLGTPTCASGWLSGRVSFSAREANSPFCIDMSPIALAVEYSPTEASLRKNLDSSKGSSANSDDRAVPTSSPASIQSGCVETSANQGQVSGAKGKIVQGDSFCSSDEEPPLWFREIGA
eukprot:TRINITY_DN1560_c0_g1_i6.p1 TRINITY_DN1560_c0_g1~~TRINITY_DN1560_c0_g1_i6.p1  ORF type:complete len:381 (-),score=50.96 TRINITY_DN1560_c0_g1_i6:297-1340(-)